MNVSGIFKFLGEFFGFVNRRHDVKNAPDVKEAAKAQKAVKRDNEIEQHVGERDADETRKDLAE